jgi:O-antigen/teichoic acid export membrane protein
MDLPRTALKMFLAKGGNAVVFFVGITLFARELGASEIGVFFLFQTVLGLVGIVADGGVRGALEKRLSEERDRGAMLTTAILLKLATVSAVCGLIFLLRPLLDQYLGGEYTPYLIVGLVLKEFGELFIQAVRGELRVGETALIQFSREAIWAALGLALVAAGYGVLGLIYGLLAGWGIAAVWAYLKLETVPAAPTEECFWSLYDYAKFYFFASISGEVYRWLDVAIIGLFLLYADVGVYQIAWEVTLLVLLVSNAIAITLFPQFSQWDAQAADSRISKAVTRAVGVALFISLPAFVGVLVLNAEILGFVFGAEYVAAAAVLVVLMVEKVFTSTNEILEGTLHAVDRPDLAARTVLVTIAVNLVLNVTLVLTIGLIGAAIATTTAAIVQTTLNGRYLAGEITLELPYRLIGWCLLGSAVMGGVLFSLKRLYPVESLPLVVAYVTVGVVVYMAVAVVVPALRREVILPGVRLLTSFV